jgi:predicted branched-subunit amino acid permease
LPAAGDAERAAAFRAGLRDMVETAPGIFAWAVVTGVAMMQSHLGLVEALVFSFLAYAGAAQLAALPLMAAGSPLWLIFFTAVMVNLRFVIYAATTRNTFSHLSWQRRLLLGYLTGDITFVVLMRRLQNAPEGPAHDSYLLGLGAVNWVVWHAGCVAGILLGARIPSEWGLEIAGTLVLLAFVVPYCFRLASASGVAAAALIAVLTYDWPLRIGLLIAIVCGVAVALTVERIGQRQPTEAGPA